MHNIPCFLYFYMPIFPYGALTVLHQYFTNERSFSLGRIRVEKSIQNQPKVIELKDLVVILIYRKN